MVRELIKAKLAELMVKYNIILINLELGRYIVLLLN